MLCPAKDLTGGFFFVAFYSSFIPLVFVTFSLNVSNESGYEIKPPNKEREEHCIVQHISTQVTAVPPAHSHNTQTCYALRGNTLYLIVISFPQPSLSTPPTPPIPI
jgi:hypothetical protein